MSCADSSHDTTPAQPGRVTGLLAALVLAELIGEPGMLGAAVLHLNESPTVAARAATLDQARDVAARYKLAWHSQATGSGVGALWVHQFEGVCDGVPVAVYALGERDPDPDVATLTGACSVALLLAGLIL